MQVTILIPWIMFTGAKALCDRLPNTGSIPKERQTVGDRIVVKDLLGIPL